MHGFENRLDYFKHVAQHGTSKDIDILFDKLANASDIPTTKVLDYCIGFVNSDEGRSRIEYYLLEGSQIQRNYATLYFARRNEYEKVDIAYKKGLIDYKQAYSKDNLPTAYNTVWQHKTREKMLNGE